MATATVMFRNGLIRQLPEWFYQVQFADWPLHVQNSLHGDIGFLPETMTVHRIHGNSMFSSMDDGARWRMTYEVFETMKRNLSDNYEPEFAEARSRLMDRMFRDLTSLRVSVDRLRMARQEISQSLEAEIQKLQTGYEGSVSMRVGRFLTWPVRVFAKLFCGE